MDHVRDNWIMWANSLAGQDNHQLRIWGLGVGLVLQVNLLKSKIQVQFEDRALEIVFFLLSQKSL